MGAMKEKCMKTIKRLKQMAYSLGIIGFISALFLSGLTFGLGAGWQIANKDNKFIPLGMNTFQDIAARYFLISAFFLLFIAFLRMRDKVFLKVVALIPLAFLIMQCRILIILKPDGLPDWVTEYSSWLEIIWYMDFCFLALAVILLILQLCLIWFVYRSSVYGSS